MLLIDIVERVTGNTFARVVDELIVRPLGLQQTSVLETPDDLMRCVPGYGPEASADGHILDVRGRYHPGWCAPRLVASTPERQPGCSMRCLRVPFWVPTRSPRCSP